MAWSGRGGDDIRVACFVGTCLDIAWSGRDGDGTRVACFVGTCLDITWSRRGGDGIRVACFVGPAVLDEVDARVGHAWASDGSVPRRGRGTSFEGCALGLPASRPKQTQTRAVVEICGAFFKRGRYRSLHPCSGALGQPPPRRAGRLGAGRRAGVGPVQEAPRLGLEPFQAQPLLLGRVPGSGLLARKRRHRGCVLLARKRQRPPIRGNASSNYRTPAIHCAGPPPRTDRNLGCWYSKKNEDKSYTSNKPSTEQAINLISDQRICSLQRCPGPCESDHLNFFPRCLLNRLLKFTVAARRDITWHPGPTMTWVAAWPPSMLLPVLPLVAGAAPGPSSAAAPRRRRRRIRSLRCIFRFRVVLPNGKEDCDNTRVD